MLLKPVVFQCLDFPGDLSVTSANPATVRICDFIAKDIENSSPIPSSTPIRGQIVSALFVIRELALSDTLKL
jgi:hypothetical protein